MKIRIDYVTNSSSSSYLVIGTEDDKLIRQMMELDGFNFDLDYFEYGAFVGHSGLCYYGHGKYPLAAGIEVANDFKLGKTFEELKNKFIKICKEKLSIDICENEVDIHFGEAEN